MSADERRALLSPGLRFHLVSDAERACDYVIVLAGSRVQVAGDIDQLQSTHHRLTGIRRDPTTLPAGLRVISDWVRTHPASTVTVILPPQGRGPAFGSAPELDAAWLPGTKPPDRSHAVTDRERSTEGADRGPGERREVDACPYPGTLAIPPLKFHNNGHCSV